MKHLFTSYSIIVFALFLSACNDSNSHDSPESKLHDIKVNYSSSDPEHTVTDRHFYIYNEADSLVQHISTSEKTPTLSLPQGKYKLIAFENIGSNIKNTENYNTITIEQSLTGEQDIFMAKAYLEMPTEYHTVYCYFRRVCGGLAIVQHPDYGLFPGSVTHFTLEITRPEGALLSPIKEISQDEVTICQENIPIYSTTSNFRIVYLFPMSDNILVHLSLTFYDKNNTPIDKWEFDESFPIESEKLTGLYLNLSQAGNQPYTVEIKQDAFQNINLYLYKESYVEIRDEKLRKALQEKPYYAEFDEQGRFNRNSVVAQNTKSISLVACELKNISQLPELYPNLTSIDVKVNDIEEFDISKFPKLEHLDCNYNKIKELHVEHCPNLKTLACEYNLLESLDLSLCTSLTTLDCFNNQLKELDLSKNTQLVKVQCYDNLIEKLTINAPNTLEKIDASYNQLISFDASNHKYLTDLSCSDNKLTNINISGCANIKKLYLSHNQLTDIELKHTPAILQLYLVRNNLQTLDLTSNLEIQDVRCDSNRLESIIFADSDYILSNFSCYGPDHTFTDIPTFKYQHFPNIGNVYLPFSAIDGPVIRETYEYNYYKHQFWGYQDIDGTIMGYPKEGNIPDQPQ